MVRRAPLAHLAAAGLLILPALLLGCAAPEPVQAPPAPTRISILPASATLTEGRRMTFGHRIASASGTQVRWRVLEPGGGMVDERGTYQAPRTPGTYRVQVASATEPDRAALAEVTVVAAPRGPLLAPDRVERGASGLRASVPIQEGMSYAWSIEGGSLQSQGSSSEIHFAAGTAGPVVLHCRMVNAAGDALTLTAEIPLAPPVVFRLDRRVATLTVGHSMKFGYSLSGGILPSVLWSLPQPGSGRLKADGTYTAPWTPGSYRVRAMPDSAPEQAAEIQVAVVDAPSGVIFAPGSVEPERTGVVAWVVARPGLKREWRVLGGSLEGDASAPTIHFSPGGGPEVELRCRLTNEAGDAYTAVRKIAIGRP